ncbi:uncharacterized protein DUF4184 [Chitinophaga polysaccharea]|uniref:Uncharacterized protein DUF4184 n=1 Tax=Chitinophaga polysaccharea TaxID=1293035 RepID=A0A561Q4M2_9BACT|nr:DUF4184 family protein [Chitinophaga polysaccharea]TWF45321.1 uncharacterized protein DUF4184 [Chitinophaga polysaccharea]
MPFTISHAAIVAPLTYAPRKYLSATGLIVGSMVPDFLYFIFLNPYFNLGHLWWGIFVYDIPLALLLSYLYHHRVKPVLLPYLPQWISSRLSPFQGFNWHRYFRQHYFVVIYSIILGVLTHFFLDAFTHEHGFFVRWWPFLQQNITVFGHTIQTWYGMQYLTSIAGLLILLLVFLKISPEPYTDTASWPQITGFWLTVGLLSTIVLVTNEHLHYIYCYRLDYLATLLGGVFYGLVSAVWLYNRIIYPSRSVR